MTDRVRIATAKVSKGNKLHIPHEVSELLNLNPNETDYLVFFTNSESGIYIEKGKITTVS